jgi:predicted DNA-binding helix-hairpin-helix protein
MMDTEQKLNILADSSKYDLACACKMADEPGRMRGPEGRWIYPAVLPSGRKTFLLKVLQSNNCVNDCSYCPFNSKRNAVRCRLMPEELAKTFMQLVDAGKVSGLFVSSGVRQCGDTAMADMLATVELLRNRYHFGGFVHLKVIPGASDAAIEQAVRIANRVSINIEAPNAKRLGQLTSGKDFYQDIIAGMEKIQRCCQQVNQQRRDKGRQRSQTTQFVVGAAGETDKEIVLATDRLYSRFDMERVYFSGYQDIDKKTETGPANTNLFNEPEKTYPDNIFVREHRLYQVDFLLRKYKFARDEIYFDENGNLSLKDDPKLVWAKRHPEKFPIAVNKADLEELLRVPGIGPIGAQQIIKARQYHKIRNSQELKPLGIRYNVANGYLAFS